MSLPPPFVRRRPMGFSGRAGRAVQPLRRTLFGVGVCKHYRGGFRSELQRPVCACKM